MNTGTLVLAGAALLALCGLLHVSLERAWPNARTARTVVDVVGAFVLVLGILLWVAHVTSAA